MIAAVALVASFFAPMVRYSRERVSMPHLGVPATCSSALPLSLAWRLALIWSTDNWVTSVGGVVTTEPRPVLPPPPEGGGPKLKPPPSSPPPPQAASSNAAPESAASIRVLIMKG